MKVNKLTMLDGSRPGEDELEEVTLEELEFKETIDVLFEGKTILLTTYDNDRSKDRLVRFKQTNSGVVTQISRPTSAMAGFTGSNRYWTLNDVSFNTLSMYPTYLYDPIRYGQKNAFEHNTLIEYISSKGDMDVAIVVGVFMNAEGDYYYKLSGEGNVMFAEAELKQAGKTI